MIISSGPWLCTILSIAIISVLGGPSENPLDHQVFRIIINYTYAGSLIGFALLEKNQALGVCAAATLIGTLCVRWALGRMGRMSSEGEPLDA